MRLPPTAPRVSPAKEQGWGFSVSVKEGGSDKANIYCSVSDAELRLIKTLLTVGVRLGGGLLAGTGEEWV